MNDLLLTIPEAATRLRLGKTMLYQLINAGELHTVRFGKAVRIPASELDELVRRQVEASSANGG